MIGASPAARSPRWHTSSKRLSTVIRGKPSKSGSPAAPHTNYLRDWIYGGIDGAVTTLAIVAGVAGADLAATVVLVLGFANLMADGLAMAASNYSGTKAERDDYVRVLGIERKHIAMAPDGEREEIRQIFAAKGFAGDDLERIVTVISS